jgi:hypothetical protein
VALLALFAALELFCRLVLYPASKDFIRFREYPARAASLAARPGNRIVLVGNSATEDGVDLAMLTANLEARGLPSVQADMFVADGSEITTWRFMLERYFWKAGLRPDHVVINFFGPLLTDQADKDLGRLAQFFTEHSDWPELFRTDLSDLPSRLEFAVSAGWATYAARERIKARLLAGLVPDYRAFETRLAAEAARHARLTTAAAAPGVGGYRALRRLLERARESETTIHFVAFPMRASGSRPSYELDPEAEHVLWAGGADLIDLRQMPDLNPQDDYRDMIHLNERGRPKFSRRLAEVLAVRLAAVPGPPSRAMGGDPGSVSAGQERAVVRVGQVR